MHKLRLLVPNSPHEFENAIFWNLFATNHNLFAIIENFVGPDGQWDAAGNQETQPWLFHHCPNGCGRKYKRSCHLKRHMKYECGVSRQFCCVYCMKEFSRRSTLKTHVAMVHGILLKNITPITPKEDFLAGAESVRLTSAKFEGQGEAERLNRSS